MPALLSELTAAILLFSTPSLLTSSKLNVKKHGFQMLIDYHLAFVFKKISNPLILQAEACTPQFLKTKIG
jgi:hypothetical protein